MSENKNLWLWVILSLVILITLAAAGYFFIVKPNINKNSSESSSQATAGELSFDQQESTKDVFLDANGPYYHKVYKAESSDGLNFTKVGKVVLDKASVPDVIRMPDGRLFIYAVDGGFRSKSGLMVARSIDDGETWEQGSLQLKNAEGKTIAGGADPETILLADGKLQLFYVVFPEKKPPLDAQGQPMATGEKIKIKSATSTDGINFIEESGSRYESTDIITDPDIVKINNTWYMYLSLGPKLIAISATDGLNYQLGKTIRDQGSVSKTVAIGEGKYRQFFCNNGIESAVSSDGLTWQDEPGKRLTGNDKQFICDPAPVKLDSKWLMFYKAQEISAANQQSPKPQN